MMYALAAVAGLVVGGIIVWLWLKAHAAGRISAAAASNEELRRQLAKAEEDFARLRVQLDALQEAKGKAEAQLAEAAEVRDKMVDTFKALSSQALDESNKKFVELAQERLSSLLVKGRGDMGDLLKPIADSLKQYDQHVKELEQHRQKAYGSLEEQVKALGETNKNLRDKTEDLVTALRRPEVRGRWGELSLRRAVELAGMTEHCDFNEQVSVQTDEGKVRPDMVVHLPGGRQVVVDAKVPLDAYLNAMSAESEQERVRYLKQHAAQMRAHMSQLAAKSYWEDVEGSPEFVVMFVPGESFFAAAMAQDLGLMESALESGVVLASPANLIALLKASAYGWRQEKITQNAQAIYELGKQLYERLSTLAEHLRNVGKGLENANRAYNDAVGSMEARLFPAARRFKEMGISSAKDIETVEPVETTPRTLTPPEPEPDE